MVNGTAWQARSARTAPDKTTTAVSAEAIGQWLRNARPGERLVYFTGFFLVPAMPAVVTARRLIEAGEVNPFQMRRGDGRFDYVIEKRANVERRGLSQAASGVGQNGRAPQTEEETEQLMAVLRRLANLGLACPTNAQLAEMAMLKDAESVRYRMGLLSIGGRISVVTPPQGPRVVTIVASGRTTARSACRPSRGGSQ